MYQADVLVNSPRMAAGMYRCRECHMNFQSQHLLTKHKQKFCVGSTADPDDLQLRRGLRSESPRRIISPDDRPLSDSLLLNKKLYQLRRLKEKRSRDRDLRDLEERMLLDDLENVEGHRSPRKSRNKIPLSKYPEIRDLQLEYEKLREKENLMGGRTVPVRPIQSRNERETPYSRNSNSSISIHLEDEYRKNPNQDQQLRSLAENHGRQMEYLQLRNRDLEKQREDIRRRLEGLGRKALVPEPHQDNTADLLRELREQEIRNQRALDDLKRQLHDLSSNQKVNVIEIERPVYPQAPPAPAPPSPRRPFVMPVFYGKSLVAEIIAIRQAYLQNGGNDPDVLSQMAQMQAEAQAIEDQMNQKPADRPREKPKDNATAVHMLEIENDRLNQELRLLQEQNLLAQNRKKSDKEGNKLPHISTSVDPRKNEVYLHLSFPNSSFKDNNRKTGKKHKRKPPKYDIRRSSPVNLPTTKQRLIGVFRPAEYRSYKSVEQVEGYYNEDRDHYSSQSEPIKNHKEKVVKYLALHNPDGTVQLSRSQSFGSYRGHSNPRPYIPPLDLRDLRSPSRRHHDLDKGRSYKPQPVQLTHPDMTGVAPPNRVSMSRITEELAHSNTVVSNSDDPNKPLYGPVTQLPVIQSQGQPTWSGSPLNPVPRSSQQPNDLDTKAAYQEPRPEVFVDAPTPTRPNSNMSQNTQQAFDDGDDVDDIENDASNKDDVTDDGHNSREIIPDVAWQVSRSSAQQQRNTDFDDHIYEY